jgi:hypothetical protein
VHQHRLSFVHNKLHQAQKNIYHDIKTFENSMPTNLLVVGLVDADKYFPPIEMKHETDD